MENDVGYLSEEAQFASQKKAEKVTYDGCQLWRIQLKDESDYHRLRLMVEVGFTIWSGNRTDVDIFVYADKKEEVAKKLEKNFLTYKVTMEDVQKTIDAHQLSIEELLNLTLTPKTESAITFERFYNLSEIYGYLDYVSKHYPFCKTITIGKSYEGIPLKVLHISRGTAFTSAWIESGVHANEWTGPSTLLYIIEYLVSSGLNVNHGIMDIDFYFLVVANPDGYRHSFEFDRLWQKNRRPTKNCIGVNLNRNFGYHFGGQHKIKDPCHDHYGGESPFSEPETIAIKDFIQKEKNKFSVYLSYHSYGQYVLYPWSYEAKKPEDHMQLQRTSDHAIGNIYESTREKYTTGAAGIIRIPHTGNSVDWAKGDQKIKFCYVIDLPDQGSYGYLVPATYIIPSARHGLCAFTAIMESAFAMDDLMTKSNAAESYKWKNIMVYYLLHKIIIIFNNYIF